MTVEFGTRFSAYAERAGLISQRKIAKKVHIRRNTLSRVLAGDSDLSKEHAIRIANAIVPPMDRQEFVLSSQGFSDKQVERIIGKSIRGLKDIRNDKMKTITRGQTVIKYRYRS